MGTVIVTVVVLAIIGFAARSLHNDKKNGKGCSGGNCGGCNGCH